MWGSFFGFSLGPLQSFLVDDKHTYMLRDGCHMYYCWIAHINGYLMHLFSTLNSLYFVKYQRLTSLPAETSIDSTITL